MIDVNYSFILPFLIIGLIIWLLKNKHYKFSIIVAVLSFLVYNGTFQSTVVDDQTVKVRNKNDIITFDRHESVSDSIKIEKEDFKTEMQDEHSELREESEELLNEYLEGNK